MNRRKILKAIFDSMTMFHESKSKIFLNSSFDWQYVNARGEDTIYPGDAYDHEDTRQNLKRRKIRMPRAPNSTRSRAHMHSRILKGE